MFRNSLKSFSRIVGVQLLKEHRQIHRWVAPTLKILNDRRAEIGPLKPEPRSSFLEWNCNAEIFAFGKRLGEEFDSDLLRQALTNRSYVIQKSLESTTKDNKELIDEGDRIISNYIKTEYSKYYPQDIVEALHKYLTSAKMLADIGKHIGLTDIVLTSEFPVEEETLANSFKAVVAALQQSQNQERAELFVKDFVMSQMNGKEIYDIWNPENPIEYLSKLLKERGIEEFEPRLCRESASNTILANYQVGLYHNKKLLGIGWGESIKIAKETAALDAIQRIHEKSQ